MLDALIQLRFPLEASVLTSIAQRYPAEATILMLQDAPGNLSPLAAVRQGPVAQRAFGANGLGGNRAFPFVVPCR
jgi:hypothetical protein